MAAEDEDADKEDGVKKKGPSSPSNGQTARPNEEDDEASEEEEDEDEEPRLKYASLTKHLKPVYRNGDATSASLVAGDKMVCTHRSSREGRTMTDGVLGHRHT